jgi:hypothetical protein
MYTKPGIVSEEEQNDQLERELNQIFLVSSPSTAAPVHEKR